MTIRGIVMSSELVEAPGDPEAVELILTAQVKPGQPRKLVVPMSILVEQTEIEPETIAGHGFEAEADEVGPKRWVVSSIAFAARRVLRPE